MKIPAGTPRIRVEMLADRGVEEILPPDVYDACDGLWIEPAGAGVKIICYPHRADNFLETMRGLGLPLRGITTAIEQPIDYAAAARKGFTAIRLRDITILPPWRKSGRTGVSIVIAPGMAFGTGRHESTKLMLGFVRKLDLAGMRVLDLGCGSGILAIYASLRGASSVLAVDNDPLAAEATKQNAALNRCDRIDIVCAGLEDVGGQFDVVLANLDFDTFRKYGRVVVPRVAAGGTLIVSGIEAQFAAGVPPLFAGMTLLRRQRLGDWYGSMFQIDKLRAIE